MYLYEALQTGLIQLETAAPKALRYQCNAARPAQLLYSAAAVTGCGHKPATAHSLGPPTESNYLGVKTAMASTAGVHITKQRLPMCYQ